jgi:hypothetical protein
VGPPGSAASGRATLARVEDRTRTILGRGTAITIIVLLVAAWVYVFTVAGQADPANTIADETFAPAAQAICADAIAQIEQFPAPQDANTAAERSEVVVASTDVLTEMLDELRAIAPPADDPEDGWVQQWLDDFGFYLEDRYAYAEALLDDPRARFLITVRDDRDRLTVDLDQVALANNMLDCGTPKDV